MLSGTVQAAVDSLNSATAQLVAVTPQVATLVTTLQGDAAADDAAVVQALQAAETAVANAYSQIEAVLPAPAPAPVTVTGLTLPASVASVGTYSGQVTLSGPAPAGGVTVDISSSDPSIAAEQVPIAAGADTGAFTGIASTVSAPVSVSVTATLDGSSATAQVTVSP